MASSSATLGKLPEFDPDNGDFEVYLERLECFIAANDIAEEKKLQVFLTTIGEKAYGTLRSLLLPKTPTKVTFEVAVDALKKHYAPKSSVVTERYRFHQRKQEKHESVADFIVGLKKLAATCAFGTFLEEALRDRLIAGLQADAVRCRLLATPDAELTWERACNIAVAMEAATKDTQQMASTKSEGIAASVSDLHWQGQAKERRPQVAVAHWYLQYCAYYNLHLGGHRVHAIDPFAKVVASPKRSLFKTSFSPPVITRLSP
ncbi:uncharacterized protein LOC119395133 [Rhipicephalus sanguineus]|uniref:uncharacterized protein LOC119395133 n=1 Tax=Rhipicephalus sanguineus TaxID=34632 RepID=UPI0018943485|nr:uncharacterized protein LOC119395133 [Rhipicephalus sanguineus]